MGKARQNHHSTDFHAQSGYVERLFCSEDQALLNAKDRGEHICPGRMISPQEGKILQCLVKAIQAKKVVEIGAFTGYSALWIVRALPADGFFWTLELQKKHVQLARLSLSEAHPLCRYEVLEGSAEESLKVLSKHGPF